MICVSVVVPVYNMESRIRKCLDSLVNQTLKDIEIIVINDGSRDKSIDIIRKYEKKYKNIKVVDRENKGISYTRNEGINLSTGEYIAFVDSDDYVELDMYEKMYNYMKKEKLDIVVCGWNSVKDDSKNPNYLNTINITSLNNNPKLVHQIDFGPCNKLFKRSLFNNITFPLNTKYEDLNTILKIFKKAKNIGYINECFYNYYVNSNGETKSIDNRVFDIFKILDDILISFNDENSKLKSEIDYLCISKLMDYIEIIAENKNVELALSFYRGTFKYLNKNIKNWRFKYLFTNNKSIKKFIFKTIQVNKLLENMHIRIKSGR